MPLKKLITLSDEQVEFMSDNELRHGVKPSKFIDTAINNHIQNLREIRALLAERKKKQMEDSLKKAYNDLQNNPKID